MRGTRQVVMDAGGGLRIGPMVCFETAFPDMSRALAEGGADVLLAQSSTSTFQQSWAPAQHASIAALRAAETGRPMVHATLTGVSAVYGPDGGRTGPWLGRDTSAAHVYDVPLAPLLAVAAWCAAEVLRVRRRSRSPRAPHARTAHGSPTRPGR